MAFEKDGKARAQLMNDPEGVSSYPVDTLIEKKRSPVISLLNLFIKWLLSLTGVKNIG